MKKKSVINSRKLNLRLNKQVKNFVNVLKDANSKRRIKRSEADYLYVEKFFDLLNQDRNTRADEIESHEYQKTVELVKELFPYELGLEGCMDGRIFGPLFGIFANMAKVLAIAGGMVPDFVTNKKTQKLELYPSSNFAFMLRRNFADIKQKYIIEILDSHLACAAREQQEITKGKFPTDHGLLADVLLKHDMGGAMIAYVKKQYSGKKAIIPVQMSMDPHNGTMYMGLGTESALKVGLEAGGYTEEVLERLVGEGKIIHTGQLLTDPKLQAIFEKHEFPIHLRSAYSETAIMLWKNITKMKDDVLPLIREKLYAVYPRLKEDRKLLPELQTRALLLLANVYIIFLLRKTYKEYPFAQHTEEGVFISKGTHPPFAIDMLGETTLDMQKLPSNLQLAVSIIRSNRKTERIKDRTKTFSDVHTFVGSPVAVTLKVRVLESIEESEWEQIEKLNWQDLTKMRWENMTDMDFLRFLENKMPTMRISVANAINKLRERMAMLYDYENVTSPYLVDQDIIMLPVIADESRRLRLVVPFLKTGFE